MLFCCYSSGLAQLQVRDQMLVMLISMWSQTAENLLTTLTHCEKVFFLYVSFYAFSKTLLPKSRTKVKSQQYS